MDINTESLLTPGTTLCRGRYSVERHLASGGFANTYLVNDIFSNGCKYVIKEFFLRGVASRDSNKTTITINSKHDIIIWEKQKKRFLKESQHISQINHPNIINVYEQFEENNTAYYRMDYIDGEALSSRINKNGLISEPIIVQYLYQLLDALTEIHQHNIYHLDIKPANILIDQSGNLYLIDFGASRQIYTEDGPTTTSSGLAYTPSYAPPEQIMNQIDALGATSDLYSLGATLFHLLTAETPPNTFVLNQENKSIAFPTHISLPMQKLINWMMSPMPKHRPQSSYEVFDYLNRLYENGNEENGEKGGTFKKYIYPLVITLILLGITVAGIVNWEYLKKNSSLTNKTIVVLDSTSHERVLTDTILDPISEQDKELEEKAIKNRKICQAYKSKLNSSIQGYFLYDITKNGVPELWILSSGEKYGPQNIKVYTFDDDIKLLYNEDIIWGDFFYGKNYILVFMHDEGFAQWLKITYTNHKITGKIIFEEEGRIEDGGVIYTEPKEPPVHFIEGSSPKSIYKALGIKNNSHPTFPESFNGFS